MQRRDFIALLGGAAVAWPLDVRAQQAEPVRRIGVMLPYGENDFRQTFFAAFKQRLRELGWIEGRNAQIEYRFVPDVERTTAAAAELVASRPEIILGNTNPVVIALAKATKSIPIVFAGVSDPVGSGLVTNLARPGGNITGFHNFETAIAGKWLELLKQVAPEVRRAAFFYNPEIATNVAFLRAAEAASGPIDIAVTPIAVRNTAEIEPALTAFAREPNGGFIVSPNPVNTGASEIFVPIAARLRLPAIYAFRFFAAGGGLLSYGTDVSEQYRGAASYVDRILHGAKAGELPVQLPTKFELVINLKTAKALGLHIPDKLLITADEVIE